MFTPSSTAKPPKIERISVKSWTGGTVTAYDDGRTPSDGLRSSGNMILDQDATLRPRPSLVKYGPTPTGTILGEIFEFKNVSGLTSTNWFITLQNVAGTTKVYIAKGEDTVWTVCNGKTFDNSAAGHFCQIGNKVLIMNGVDNLSYLDIPTSTVIPFTALTTPSAPTVVNNGSDDLTTAATFSITYRITANSSVGETDASASTARTVKLDRDLWDPTKNSLKITWSAVASAVSYNVYMGTVAGFEYLIAAGVNGLQFIDDGSAAQDTTRLFPSINSTSGPAVTRGTVINGRVFLVGDKNNPYYVRYGGDFGFELDFSPVNGGGFNPVGNGTKELPVKIMPFRDGKGSSQITVLCQGTNGRGKRYLLTPDTLTVGSTTISFFDVIEDNGQDGTDSPDGVILYQDSLWYPSRDGFKTTGTKPQLQNVLSTDRVSNTIQKDIKNLNNSSMGMCVGIGFEGRLYWALPVGATTNNEVWVLDLDRGGAWMKPWSMSVSWMMLYNDNSGNTHHIVLSNNVIYELAYTQLTNDNGTAFSTSASSGLIKFSPDGREWGKIVQVIFTLLRPQGSVNVSIAGKTEDSSLATVGTQSFTPSSTIAGWSEAAWGTYAWSNFQAIPVAFGDASVDIIVDVDEEVQWWEYNISSTTANVDFNLSDVVAEFINIGVRDLS